MPVLTASRKSNDHPSTVEPRWGFPNNMPRFSVQQLTRLEQQHAGTNSDFSPANPAAAAPHWHVQAGSPRACLERVPCVARHRRVDPAYHMVASKLATAISSSHGELPPPPAQSTRSRVIAPLVTARAAVPATSPHTSQLASKTHLDERNLGRVALLRDARDLAAESRATCSQLLLNRGAPEYKNGREEVLEGRVGRRGAEAGDGDGVRGGESGLGTAAASVRCIFLLRAGRRTMVGGW